MYFETADYRTCYTVPVSFLLLQFPVVNPLLISEVNLQYGACYFAEFSFSVFEWLYLTTLEILCFLQIFLDVIEQLVCAVLIS